MSVNRVPLVKLELSLYHSHIKRVPAPQPEDETTEAAAPAKPVQKPAAPEKAKSAKANDPAIKPIPAKEVCSAEKVWPNKAECDDAERNFQERLAQVHETPTARWSCFYPRS